jgi:hypothetical protein
MGTNLESATALNNPEIKPYFFLNLSLQPKNMPKGLLKNSFVFAEKSGIDLDLIADDLL